MEYKPLQFLENTYPNPNNYVSNGVEKTTLPTFTDMSMIHMKQFINGTYTEDWTDTFVYELLPNQIRVQTVPQLYPFHYHKKAFADKLIEI